ncbi:hypothetical protein BDZ91DRAFT_711165 [Kalaharituber pfeilii]|nr:hypothetical protein BDZ91DRAFT_711165 [Kalaharituber pfeilii]
MAHLFDLTGKTALVTGGTRGLGAAMAIGLAEAGADIILVQRDITNTTTRDRILSLPNPRQCTLVQCDLSSATEVASLIPTLLLSLDPPVVLPPNSGDGITVPPPDTLRSKKYHIPNNTIHILLNSAGIQSRHPSHQFPLSEFNSILQTNLTTPFQLARDIGNYWLTQIPVEARKNDRCIINIASVLSFQGGVTVPAYTASKGGLAQITKTLSNDWAGKGIRVNSIAPGYVATDMNTALMEDTGVGGRARQILERIPMGRWGNPDDFKGVVIWLASEKASGFVSGETVVVDGGWMAR